MSLVSLAVDFDNSKFLASNRQASDRGDAQPMVWKNYTQLQIYPVLPNPLGGQTNPLQAVDVTGKTVQLFIGVPGGDLYASLIDFVTDEVNNRFTGVISLNSVKLTAAFANPNTKSISAWIEVRLISDGEPRSVIKKIRIDRPIWEGDTPPDAEDQTPEWLVENLSLILDDTEDIEWVIVGNSIKAQTIRKDGGRILKDAEGLYFEESTPAPDGLVPQMRLESPYAGAMTSINPSAANANGSDAVTVGGDADRLYRVQFRVRGTTELRTYTGGSAIGRFYSEADAMATIEAGLLLKNRNWWKVTVSSPQQEYYLNYDVTHGGAAALDYITPHLLVRGGATVTLAYDTLDGLQLPYDQLADPPSSVDPSTPPGVPFIQVDQYTPVDNPDEGDETTYQLLEIDEDSDAATLVRIEDPHRIKSLDVDVTVDGYSSPFTRIIVLEITGNLHDGDFIPASLLMPASTYPTIQFRNGTSTGTVLISVAGDGVAGRTELRFVFDGTQWLCRYFNLVGSSVVPLYKANDTGSTAPTATGDRSVAIGSGAQSNGGGSAVLGGLDNHADGTASAVIAGRRVQTKWYSEVAFGGRGGDGYMDKAGWLYLGRDLTSATPVPLFLGVDGALYLDLEEDSVMAFQGIVDAWCESTGEVAMWEVKGVIKNLGGTTTLFGDSVTEHYKAFATADLSLAADDTNDALELLGTGEASKIIRMRAALFISYMKA